MDENDIALLDVVRFFHKGDSSGAMDKSRRSHSGRDGVGDRINRVPRNGNVFCVHTTAELHKILVKTGDRVMEDTHNSDMAPTFVFAFLIIGVVEDGLVGG